MSGATRYLVATLPPQGVAHVASTTSYASVKEAWAAVFAFDKSAAEWWADYSKRWPNDVSDGAPWRDSIINGSVHRWTLVEAPP